jgi:hypothetical protein
MQTPHREGDRPHPQGRFPGSHHEQDDVDVPLQLCSLYLVVPDVANCAL